MPKMAAMVGAAIFGIVFYLTWQLYDYAELGDYLIRLGFSWLFLTFLSFLAFSGVVTSLSTFFLSEDLRLLLAAPVARDRLFYSRFVKTVGQAGWMVATFLVPVVLGVGLARCAGPRYYVIAVLAAAGAVPHRPQGRQQEIGKGLRRHAAGPAPVTALPRSPAGRSRR